MAQSSRPWEAGLGDGIGAGAGGCYTADQWDDIFWAVFSGRNNDYGVIRMTTYLHLEVFPTTPPSSQVNVGTGSAIVNGKYYENDAAVTFPAAGFPAITGVGRERYDRVVLEADWVTRTVRIARVAGVEAATGFGVIPALTQIEGVLFQLPLATIYVDEFGIVAIAAADITDDREFIEGRTHTFDAIVGARPGDYATIQDALDDDHLSIFVRAGTYTPAADIVLTSGMWLCGESPENTIINLGANQILVNEAAAAFADHVTAENLQLESTDVNGSLSFARARNCIARNIYVLTGEGLRTTTDSLNCIIENCHIDTAAVNGIGVEGAEHIIRNNHVVDAVQIGINCQATRSIVSGNVVDNSTGLNIRINGTNVRVIGNASTGGTDGITVVANQCIINGNTVRDATGRGIDINAVRCIVSHNKVSGSGGNGIEIDATHCIVEGNHVYDNTGIGISFTTQGDYSKCGDNICLSNGGDGIDVPNNCDQIILLGNLCRDNTGWGIDYAGDRCNVAINILLNNTAGQLDNIGATNSVETANIVA